MHLSVLGAGADPNPENAILSTSVWIGECVCMFVWVATHG